MCYESGIAPRRVSRHGLSTARHSMATSVLHTCCMPPFLHALLPKLLYASRVRLQLHPRGPGGAQGQEQDGEATVLAERPLYWPCQATVLAL